MIRPPAATLIGLNLAPMVDVMMCLLIFFMLATKMVEQENSQIDLPYAASVRQLDKQELGNRGVINIRDARLTGGEGAAYLIRESVVSLAEVRRFLSNERRRDAELNCVIRADREVAYQYVEAVMAACAATDVRHVTFGARQTDSGPRTPG